MSSPRVSVICPVYNAERYLAEAIESVLAQDFDDFELLLIDDGSADGSTGIAIDYARRHPGRIRYLEHEGHANRGQAASRNLGLAQSRAEFVAFIDADDVWRPGKLSGQLAILARHSEAGMAAGAVNYWRSWAGGRDRVLASGKGLSRPPATALKLYPLGRGVAPCPSDVMVRRSVVDEVGGFNPDFAGRWELYEDQTFLTKVYLATPVYFAPDVWLDYRIHGDSSVATLRRRGLQSESRRYFLDWLSGYVASKDFPGRELVTRAIARAYWDLDHPRLATTLRRARKAYRRLLGLPTP